MDPDEFEAAIDRNLRLLNDKSVDPLTAEKRRRLVASGTLDQINRVNEKRRWMNEMRRDYYAKQNKDGHE